MAICHAEESPNFTGQGAGREPLVQARGQRCKPPATESATESEPPRETAVRVKRRCKRPPGIPVMGYAMKTSPKQGRIGTLFPRERELPAQFQKGTERCPFEEFSGRPHQINDCSFATCWRSTEFGLQLRFQLFYSWHDHSPPYEFSIVFTFPDSDFTVKGFCRNETPLLITP